MEQNPHELLLSLEKLNAGVFSTVSTFAGGVSGGEMMHLSERTGPRDYLAYGLGWLVTAAFAYGAGHEWQRFQALRQLPQRRQP